jgi:hypothetical protein
MFLQNYYSNDVKLSIVSLIAGLAMSDKESICIGVSNIICNSSIYTEDVFGARYVLEEMEENGIIKLSRLELSPGLLNAYWEGEKGVHPLEVDGWIFEDYYNPLKSLLESQKELHDLDEHIGLDRLVELQGGILYYFEIPNQGTAKKMVDEYLDRFEADELQVSGAIEPWAYKKQEAYLDKLISQKILDAKDVISISGVDYYDNNDGSRKRFALAETVLNYQRKGLITVQNLGVDFSVPDYPEEGIFYAKLLVNKPSEFAVHTQPKEKMIVEAKIDGTQILIGITGEDMVPLWRVRSDSGSYNFMHYVQSHTNQNIGIGDIQLLDRCKTYSDLTEVVRNLHFNRELKKIFFDGTSKKNVRFTPTKSLNEVESLQFMSIINAIRK